MTLSNTESSFEQCPYCGEDIEVQIDLSAGSQSYIEDCPVCCRPIEYRLEMDPQVDHYSLSLHRDDD